LIESARWIGVTLLALAVGCGVGEARPEVSLPGPAVEPPPAERPDRPAVPAAEAERRASDLAGRAAVAYEAAELTTALELAQEAVALYPGAPSSVDALWVAARAAFSLERYGEAAELAAAYEARQARNSDAARSAASLRELAADAQQAAGHPVPVIGAILPRTGSQVMVQYGDWVLEGIQLAVREAERRQGRAIDLRVADDGGGMRTAQAMAELERAGAVAVVGPLFPEQLPDAAAGRTNPQLVIVSPTIPEAPAHWSRVYSVVGGDTRGAAELGRYAAQMGLRQAAILHARGAEYYRRAQAFAAEFEAGGGRVATTVSYESGTTTFAPHMRQILAAVGGGSRGDGPGFGLFMAAPDRDIPQIAPQVGFYGLDEAGVQVFGDGAWASTSVRRVVPNRDLEGIIVASALPSGRAEALADPDFVALFEQTYRRSLNNQLPALGYDAAYVLLQALPNRLVTPEATARRFDFLSSIHGATGTLSVRAGGLVRTPHLMVIRNGVLAPAPRPREAVPASTTPGSGPDRP
jgi:hypothetical protein